MNLVQGGLHSLELKLDGQGQRGSFGIHAGSEE